MGCGVSHGDLHKLEEQFAEQIESHVAIEQRLSACEERDKALSAEVGDVKKVVANLASGFAPSTAPLTSGSGRHVGTIHPLGNFVVNLLDPGNVRYVNCRIEIEVEDSATIKEITARDAQFKDAVISLLGNQSYEDLLGTEGKAQVRKELMVRFNRMLRSGQIARVYITEFVVQ